MLSCRETEMDQKEIRSWCCSTFLTVTGKKLMSPQTSAKSQSVWVDSRWIKRAITILSRAGRTPSPYIIQIHINHLYQFLHIWRQPAQDANLESDDDHWASIIYVDSHQWENLQAEHEQYTPWRTLGCNSNRYHSRWHVWAWKRRRVRTIIIDLAVPIDICLTDHVVDLFFRELLTYTQRTT